jgi:hypothetical protein
MARADPSLGVEAGIIRDQKLSNAAKPLDPVSTNVVNVRSNSNKRAARGDATASRLSGSTTRASRGWGNDDRHDDADFEFGETDKSAVAMSPESPNPNPENPAGGGGSRRLSPLSSRNRSPPGSSPGDVTPPGGNNNPQNHQKQQQQHPGSALEDLDDDDDDGADNNKLEASMRSNQQDEDDYEDDYEDEFEEAADLSDLSPKVAPKQESSPPAKSGGLFAKRSPGNDNNINSRSAADESGEDFEDAFDDSFGLGDDSDHNNSPAALQDKRANSSNVNGNSAKEKASWGTKGGAAVESKRKDSSSSSPLQKEEAVVLQDLDESVASEDIEDFEVSVADNSDSFSFLNESMNSQRSKGGTTRSNSKAALNTSQASEGSNVMDFSVTEHELSSSAATLGDFDHAVKALPPLRTQKK